MFANVYVMARNEIYLMDDAGYYRRIRRTLDESLAHEFAHYLQVALTSPPTSSMKAAKRKRVDPDRVPRRERVALRAG